LIVDSEESARRYGRALEAYGYLVEAACDGDSAVRLASERHFDVVVGDMDMHDCSCEALRLIRGRHHDITVILISSGLAFARARAAVECGADRYLLKPVSEEQLLEILVETTCERLNLGA
jgi:DNA-binding NtrC family response regulator